MLEYRCPMNHTDPQGDAVTKINDYMWQMPHEPLADDPPDVQMLNQMFNAPVAAGVERALEEMGYRLTSSDVLVRLDDRIDHTADTFYANVRFITYLQPDVLARVHFEHGEWAHFLPDSETHHYSINLDRFKVQDPSTQVAVPAWGGRLHSRMTSRRDPVLHHDGEDQIWTYSTPGELAEQLMLFLEKFERLGRPWLEDPKTMD